jgi:hypothetical protein
LKRFLKIKDNEPELSLKEQEFEKALAEMGKKMGWLK